MACGPTSRMNRWTTQQGKTWKQMQLKTQSFEKFESTTFQLTLKRHGFRKKNNADFQFYATVLFIERLPKTRQNGPF
jgi:hypothetical protein